MVTAAASEVAVDDLTERLLDAAAEVFAERGIDKAGVVAVARRAGVTTGAIYSRWAGKHDMMIAALNRVMSKQLHQTLLAHPDPSAPNLLAALGEELVTGRDNAADSLLMEALALARRDVEFGDMLGHMLAEQETHLAMIIDEGKSLGTIDESLDTDSVAALCYSISLGFVMFGAIGRPLPTPYGWNRVVQRMITAALPSPDLSDDPKQPGAD